MDNVRPFLALLALVLTAPALEAAWLQSGADSARTGATLDPGPIWSDVALRTNVSFVEPVWQPYFSDPVWIQDALYVVGPTEPPVMANVGADCGARTTMTLYRVPTTGAVPAALAQIPSHQCSTPVLLATEDRLFVVTGNLVAGIHAESGAPMWNATIPPPLSQMLQVPGLSGEQGYVHRSDCVAALDRHIVLGCQWITPDYGVRVTGILAFDLEGQLVAGPILFDDYAQRALDYLETGLVPYEASPDVASAWIAGLATAGDVAVLASTQQMAVGQVEGATPEPGYRFGRLWVVDLAREVDLWSGRISTNLDIDGTDEDIPIISRPLISGDYVYVKGQSLYRWGLTTGANRIVGPSQHDRWYNGDSGGGCALLGSDLVCTFGNVMRRLDPTFSVVWETSIPAGERWGPGGLVVTPEQVLGVTELTRRLNVQEPAAGSRLVSVDSRLGGIRWTQALPETGGTGKLAVSDHAAGLVQRNGEITVIGQTAASPRPSLTVTTEYPEDGEEVVVQVKVAGGLGEIYQFQPDWGDGVTHPWQSTGEFRHRYPDKLDHAARFWVRNEAGQTASSQVVFHVGQADPNQNLLNAPFSSRYQETTFFILGLAVTAAAAVFGILRAGRKRRMLHRELRVLEADFARLKDDVPTCDAMLRDAKSRARALFLERRLEEAHASFLERRNDELRQRLRLAELDERLDFLPFGMVKALQEMLQDHRVTAWERHHFLEALERDRTMGPKQKARVAAMVHQWFVADRSP